jgi:hypothetical protein
MPGATRHSTSKVTLSAVEVRTVITLDRNEHSRFSRAFAASPPSEELDGRGETSMARVCISNSIRPLCRIKRYLRLQNSTNQPILLKREQSTACSGAQRRPRRAGRSLAVARCPVPPNRSQGTSLTELHPPISPLLYVAPSFTSAFRRLSRSYRRFRVALGLDSILRSLLSSLRPVSRSAGSSSLGYSSSWVTSQLKLCAPDPLPLLSITRSTYHRHDPLSAVLWLRV